MTSRANSAAPPPPRLALSPTADTKLGPHSPVELDDQSLLPCSSSSNETILVTSDDKAHKLILLTSLPTHNDPPFRQVCYDHQPCSDHVVHVAAPVNEMEKTFQEWRRLERSRGANKDRAIVIIGTATSAVVRSGEVRMSCCEEDANVMVRGGSVKNVKGHAKKDSGVDVADMIEGPEEGNGIESI